MRGANANGDSIQRLRSAHGLTQEHLASIAGVDVKTLRRAERAERVDIRTLDKLAVALGVPSRQVLLPTDAAAEHDAERNAALFRAWNEAHFRCDLEETHALYHPEAIVSIPGAADLPGGGDYHGAEAIRAHLRMNYQTFQTEPVSPDDYRIDTAGDIVWVRGTAIAVVRATGHRFTAMVVHELEVRDGLIYRHTIVTDTAVMRPGFPDVPPPGG